MENNELILLDNIAYFNRRYVCYESAFGCNVCSIIYFFYS